MGSRSFIAVCGLLLVALVAAVGGAYAYDSGRDDLIAPGVTVGGIDVGGLRVPAARERLRSELFAPLRQPVVVRHRGRKWSLDSREASVVVDLERSIAEAVRRSRRGSLLERTLRGLRDEPVRAKLDVDIRYDIDAVDELVAAVRKQVDREAVDADVEIGASGVSTRRSRAGIAVRGRWLRRQVTRRLVALEGSREVRVRTRTVEPEVTESELAERYPAILVVNRDAFRLTLYKNLKPAKTYRIAVGQAGMDTPVGRYSIQNKAENPAWHVPDSDWAGELRGKVIPPDDPRNPIEARWMGIYDGAGIHGTTAVASLGTRASHGCIRMAIPDVIELYDQVPVQAPVYIA